MTRSHLKNVVWPNPPEADKSLCWALVSTPRNTSVCLWIESRSRVLVPPIFGGRPITKILFLRWLLVLSLYLNETGNALFLSTFNGERIPRSLSDQSRYSVSTGWHDFNIMLRWRKHPYNLHRCHKFFS